MFREFTSEVQCLPACGMTSPGGGLTKSLAIVQFAGNDGKFVPGDAAEAYAAEDAPLSSAIGVLLRHPLIRSACVDSSAGIDRNSESHPDPATS